ncbi:MAG: hypothetical protein LBH54_03715, partial [Clostridiales bacterium]|nr:hypothetical protein [Clostridiales bacterium]
FPVSFYKSFNIPEYKAGTVTWAQPGDDEGRVYFKTTREEVIAYVDALKAAGFRIYANDYDRLQKSTWSDFDVYFPEVGGKYALAAYYSFENDGKGAIAEGYDEKSGEEIPIEYNFSMRVASRGLPEGFNKTGLLTPVGIDDHSLTPENAEKIVSRVETLGTLSAAFTVTVDFQYDFDLTPDFANAYAKRIMRAAESAADDKRVYDGIKRTAIDIDTADKPGHFLYTYQGAKYMVQFIWESGYGEEFNIGVVKSQE